MSETSKYRHLTRQYCLRDDGQAGCGVDIASGGDPVVPWAWQLELCDAEYIHYNGGHSPRGPIQLKGDAARRCAEDGSLDFVYSSHLLEDYLDWQSVLSCWKAMLKPGGKLIILCPEKERWAAAIAAGQPPNCSHKREPVVGELTKECEQAGFVTIVERLTAVDAKDYSILYVGRKP